MNEVRTEERSPEPGAAEPTDQPKRDRHPRREPLSRDRIIKAALRLMDEEGLDAVTMRRIGRALGVEAMSLYNHVRDKEDILDGIVEEVLSELEIPDIPDLAEAIRGGANSYRRILLAHPNVVILMTERKSAFSNAESLRAYEYSLERFRTAGLSVADSFKAFHAFGGFILGFVVMELGFVAGGPDDEEHRQAHEQMARLLDSPDLPRMREALPYFIDCDLEEQFAFGLDLLIQGLLARLPGTTS